MKVKFTTTFTQDVLKTLKKQAIDEGVDVNTLIERWVKEHEKDGK